MTNTPQARLPNLYACHEWAEAYIDLETDELMQRYVISLNQNEAGRHLLELSRRIWREHGLRVAPFDFILLKVEASFSLK